MWTARHNVDGGRQNRRVFAQGVAGRVDRYPGRTRTRTLRESSSDNRTFAAVYAIVSFYTFILRSLTKLRYIRFVYVASLCARDALSVQARER